MKTRAAVLQSAAYASAKYVGKNIRGVIVHQH